jgi:hypothetical protein
MWQADAAQRGRVQRLAQGLVEEVPSLWEALHAHHWPYFLSDNNYHWQEFQLIIGRLEARLGVDELRLAIPEYLVFPVEHGLPTGFEQGEEEPQRLVQFAHKVAMKWVSGHGDPYAVGLIGRYLQCKPSADPQGRWVSFQP